MSIIQMLMAGSGGVSDALLVGQQAVGGGVGSTSAILSTLGAAVNDIAVVCSNGGAPSAAGGGAWTAISNTSPTLPTMWWKILTAPNVAGVVTPGANNVNWQIIIIRNAVSLTSVRTANAVSSGSATGITRNANHAGLVALVTTADGGAAGTITGWTKPFGGGTVGPLSGGGHVYDANILIRTAPPAAAYVNLDPFAYNGASSSAVYLVVAELRR